MVDMKYMTVDKAKILHNLQRIQETAGTAGLIAVLKANAYGLDLRQMAQVLSDAEVRRFAVTDPLDAVQLRDWGFTEQEILVLRSTACEQDIAHILSACATATVGSYDAAVALNGIAERDGLSCDVHIKVDTGMGRYGFAPSEIERIVSVYRFMPALNVTGMYTHYANAFRNKPKTQVQHDDFRAVVQKVRDAGFEPGLLHASNSAAVFWAKTPALDAVRVGSAIGGRLTAKGDFGLQKVGVLHSQITEVRWLSKGNTVGYGSAYVVKRPTKIAIVPIGTSDGFMLEKARDSFRLRDSLRAAAGLVFNSLRHKRFYAFVDGKRARVLGHVGLNHTVLDVTDIDCAAQVPVTFEMSPLFVPSHIERRYV